VKNASFCISDEKLARCLQECEHEAYAEQSLKENSLRQIMDETYALSLAEKDSVGLASNIFNISIGNTPQFQLKF
jgi:hypothetical protein